jgi:hypothetical protein
MNQMPVLEHLAVSEVPDLLAHDGLYAVVGRVPAEDFNVETLPARLNDLNWLGGKVRLHERVIEHATQYGSVMPFKFGTVFRTEENVHLMLETHATEFRQKLTELAGKEEWGVKVYCDRERLAQAIGAGNPALVNLDREIGSAPKGRGFLLAKRRGELVATAVQTEIARLGQECFDRLARLTVGQGGQGLRARANDPLPPEAVGGSETMILNGAFLVAKEKTPQFLSAVNRLQEQLGSHGLRFQSTGPWPPYNFCEFSPESDSPPTHQDTEN